MCGCEVGEVPGEEVPDQAGEDAAQHAPQAEHQHAGRRHQPDTWIFANENCSSVTIFADSVPILHLFNFDFV